MTAQGGHSVWYLKRCGLGEYSISRTWSNLAVARIHFPVFVDSCLVLTGDVSPTSCRLTPSFLAWTTSQDAEPIESPQIRVYQKELPATIVGETLRHVDQDHDQDETREHVLVPQNAARDVEFETDASSAEDAEGNREA